MHSWKSDVKAAFTGGWYIWALWLPVYLFRDHRAEAVLLLMMLLIASGLAVSRLHVFDVPTWRSLSRRFCAVWLITVSAICVWVLLADDLSVDNAVRVIAVISGELFIIWGVTIVVHRRKHTEVVARLNKIEEAIASAARYYYKKKDYQDVNLVLNALVATRFVDTDAWRRMLKSSELQRRVIGALGVLRTSGRNDDLKEAMNALVESLVAPATDEGSQLLLILVAGQLGAIAERQGLPAVVIPLDKDELVQTEASDVDPERAHRLRTELLRVYTWWTQNLHQIDYTRFPEYFRNPFVEGAAHEANTQRRARSHMSDHPDRAAGA